MVSKAMSYPIISSAVFILSRTFLYAALWFVVWTLTDYLTAGEDFHLRLSWGDFFIPLFGGWLFALMNWQAGGDKKNIENEQS